MDDILIRIPNIGLFSGTLSDAMNELAAFFIDSFDSAIIKFYNHFHLEKLDAWRLLFFIIGFTVTFVFAKIISWFIGKKLSVFVKRTDTLADDIFLDAIGKPIGLAFLCLGIYVSAVPLFILFSDNTRIYFGRICLAIFASSFAWALYRLVSLLDYFLKRLAQRTDNNLDDMIVAVIRRALKTAIFLLSAIFIGQNILKLNITAVLAGAGVAGLAIAFAAQDTIANFFGSVMIILDRPFKIKDRIKVGGGTDGIVEQIGFRSTKVRTLDGHLVSIPNKSLAETEIENISERPYIKQVTNITVTYDTSPEKMQRAIEILHEIFDNHEFISADFPPRINFNAFNDWSLNIMIVCWYHTNDYWKFQEINHKNNMEILKRFNAEGIEFAFPTSTTYLAGDPKRKPEFNLVFSGKTPNMLSENGKDSRKS